MEISKKNRSLRSHQTLRKVLGSSDLVWTARSGFPMGLIATFNWLLMLDWGYLSAVIRGGVGIVQLIT